MPRRPGRPGLARFVTMLAALPAAAYAGADFTWLGGAGTWSDPAAWGGALPTPGSNVHIDGGNPATSVVTLNTSASIGSLILDAGDTLQWTGTGRVLTVTNAIVNHGLMLLNDTGAGIVELRISGSVTLDGNGVIRMESQYDNHITAANGPADLLTVGDGQTITTSLFTFFGGSQIHVRVVNNGRIEAAGGQLDLASHPKTNHATMGSSNGGNLRFLNIELDNADGVIDAGPDSYITYYGATIAGGLLTGPGIHGVTPALSTLDGSATPVTIDAGTPLEVIDGTGKSLRLIGTIVNNGLITLEDVGVLSNEIRIDGPVTLAGDGVLRLENDGDNHILAHSGSDDDILTIDDGQTVSTNEFTLLDHTRLDVSFVNHGVIEANGGALDVGAAALQVNHGRLRAIAGGHLRLSGDLDNSDGEIDVAADSTLTLNGATVTGGRLLASGVIAQTAPATLGVTLLPAGEGPGVATFSGDMPTLAAESVVEIDLGGPTPRTQHDVIDVAGAAAFGGALRVRGIDGFAPQAGDRFVFANYLALSDGAHFTAFAAIDFPDSLTARAEYFEDRAEIVVVMLGDMNCDGHISTSDIAPMVTALSQPDEYKVHYPGCSILTGDFNADGIVSVTDIGPFVERLTGS
jgi:hypothetical protein